MLAEEYKPYGVEWEAEMLKFTKAQLVALLRRAYTSESGQPAHNSRYVTALENSYGILNRMGGALEGCRAELAIVIERLNAAKAPHCT
jgi:hypothetical protein